MKLVRILLFATLVLAFSCKEEGSKQSYLPASIGPINSLVVVMDNELWKGEVGDKVREYFAAPEVGLIWAEPLFSINHFPPQTFSGVTRQSRSILYVQKDSLDLGHLKTDMYATPQKVGVVKGRTNDEIMANLDEKAPQMIEAFKKLEIGETQKRFLRSLNKEGVLEEKFGIAMNIPSIYKVGMQEDNFVWIDRQILEGTMNIIAYTMPEKAFKNDSTLVSDIVRMRDSIGKTYIPGGDVPGKVTYMRTDPGFAPHVFSAKLADRNAIEVRGIWDIKNYAMAGTFLTYIVDDPTNKRKVVVEGFTFAPATAKRDYMFELEAILKTLKFTGKKK